MRFSRNLLIFTLLISALLGAFALPQFTIPLGEQAFTWPALDFSLFDIESPFANFRKGSEIYDSIEVTAKVSSTNSQEDAFQEILTSDLELISSRLMKSGLSDVELVTHEDVDGTTVSFVFPEYYSDKNLDRLVSFLLSPGNFQIYEHDNNAGEDAIVDTVIGEFFPGYVTMTSSIRPEDIIDISLVTDSRYGGDLLRVDFSQNASSDIADAIARIDTSDSSDIKPPILAIDGVPQFTLLSIGEELALVSSALDPSTDMIQFRVITQFADEELGARLTYSDLETTSIPSYYASEGRKLLAATFVVSMIFLCLWSLRAFDLIGGFTYFAGLGTYLVYGLALLKLGGMPISSGVVLGFSVMYILGAVVVYDLLKIDKVLLETRLKLYRDLGAFGFIASGAVFSLGLTFGLFSETIAVMAFMSIALFLSATLGFKQIFLNFHVNRKN